MPFSRLPGYSRKNTNREEGRGHGVCRDIEEIACGNSRCDQKN